MQKAKSTCRLCINCGFEFEIDDGKIVSAKPDKDYAMSNGYACTKGLDYIAFQKGDGVPRLARSLKRQPNGIQAPIHAQIALDEIAGKLTALIKQYGPRSVALYCGTGSYANTIAYGMARSLIHAIGTPNLYSTLTIDQPQKVLTPLRMGIWLGGKQAREHVDVFLNAGANPVISHVGHPNIALSGFDPGRSLKADKERGAFLIVVDPRKSETAARADLHLQLKPGEDAALYAALVHVILTEGLEKKSFRARWLDGVEQLQALVAPFAPGAVEARVGVPAADIVRAARVFAAGARPLAGCATGVCMTPHSNLAEFLIECLNALCGGYRVAGDPVPAIGAFFGQPPVEAALPPNRTWEQGPFLRTQNTGPISGEYPTPLLPDEILAPGDDKIRALIVFSGNPVVAMVDPEKTRAALDDLDLLVTLDHRQTETTALSDYALATSTFYERHELSGYMEMCFDKPFVDYTPPLVEKPDTALHDWEVFWGLAKRMGIPLEYKYTGLLMDFAMLPPGVMLDMGSPPSEEDLCRHTCEARGIDFDALKASPGGMVLDQPVTSVLPTPPGMADTRLTLCPRDLVEAFERLAKTPSDKKPFRLASRRLPHVMNSVLQGAPRLKDKGVTNPAFLNPDDMKALTIEDGDAVEIRSDFGALTAPARADKTVRQGVVSIAHCFGDSHSGALVPLDDAHREPICYMPHQTGVPVTVTRKA